MKKILATLGLTLVLTTGNALAESNVTAAIAGSVNGMNITVADADKALNVLTKGKMTWEKLPEDGRKQLIERMALNKLVADTSKKDLSQNEKDAALAGFWMQKKMSKVEISDKEIEDAYNKMKKAAKAAKSKEKFPELKAVKNSIKMQLAQGKIVSELMKSAEIKLK